MCKELKKKDGQAWEENGLIYMEGRIYVPNSQNIKERILQENHKLVDVGHPEQQQMMNLIKRNYWWPGIKKDIKKYIQECFKCQQNKVQYMKKTRELFFIYTRRPMKRNQYQHHWSITKIQWKECNCSDCGQVYKDDLTQGNNNKCVIGGDCKDLPRWNIKIIWGPKNYSQW